MADFDILKKKWQNLWEKPAVPAAKAAPNPDTNKEPSLAEQINFGGQFRPVKKKP